MNAKTGWMGLGVLVMGAGAVLSLQYAALNPLRVELALWRSKAAEGARLSEEHRRLTALQVPEAEMESLRSDRAAVSRMRAEIEGLRERAKTSSTVVENKTLDRFAIGQQVPSTEWRNVGASTPPAALETALWAAAGGDVDAFAALLMFDAASRRTAQALLDSLPADTRARYGSPEKLIAFLTIKDVPLGSVQLHQWTPAAQQKVMLARMIVSSAEGKTKDVTLPMMREDSTWKLFVVDSTVQKYAAMLKAPAAATK